MRDDREQLTALVTEAVQRLRGLHTDIRQQGMVDPALAWIAYRVREVEELLLPASGEPIMGWAGSVHEGEPAYHLDLARVGDRGE